MSDYEERAVPVHPSQSRRAMSNYKGAGVPILGNGMGGGGMYVIVIAVPVGAPTPDWQAAPPRAASPFRPIIAFNWRVFVQIMCALAIVCGLAYFGYAFVSGADVRGGDIAAGAQDAAATFTGWLDDRLATLRPLPNGEPVVETTAWRWPWESKVVNAPKFAGSSEWSWMPANPVGDAIDGAGQVITWLVCALVLVGVLWAASIAFGAYRRFRG